MIYINIKKELRDFETDIRDLCMAFFPYKKLNFIYDDNNININKDDILIDNYYSGKFYNERIENKNNIKRSLYNHLSKLTNKTLPYGALTGIRPVNILTQIIEYLCFSENTHSETINNFIKYLKENPINLDFNNQTIDNKNLYEIIEKFLKTEYLVSNEKSKLLYDIAIREINILKTIPNFKNNCSIYISVPFCVSTCLYCSFTSFNINKWGNFVDKYLETLDSELKNNIEIKNKKIISLYIGGGTPTSFDNLQFKKFLEIIKKHIDLDKIKEFTIEAGRPDTINSYKLKLMKDFNVHRISINPQTFNQKTLDLIGRKHTVKQIIDSFNLARNLGFNNINMDLILGLPNEKLVDVINSLKQVINLNPESITTHMLSLKRASRLNYEKEIWENEYLAGINDDYEIEKMSNESFNMITNSNFLPYYLYRQKNISGNLENIGFSKITKECLYNILMMSERHTVIGFGCGATSKIVNYGKNGEKTVKRIDGFKSIVDYTKKHIE